MSKAWNQSLLVLFLLGLGEVRCGNLTAYCFVRQANTPCKGCERSPRCGITDDGFQYLNAEERSHILGRHNRLRNEVAGGLHETDHHLRAARDMQILNWDKEVEFFAGCYSKHCLLEHDRVRVMLDGTTIGQNLFLVSMSHDIADRKHILDLAFDSWAEEIKYLTNLNVLHIYKKFARILAAGPTGHLLQMIWGDSKLLGCAIMHFLVERHHNYHVICNYAPPGNVLDEALYSPGHPECRGDVHNTNYTNLCGKTRTFEEDKFVYPIQLSGASSGFGDAGLPLLFLLRFILHLICL